MPKSTRNIGLSELRVGLLVFIALTVLIVLILNASGELNPFKSHLHLRARGEPGAVALDAVRDCERRPVFDEDNLALNPDGIPFQLCVLDANRVESLPNERAVHGTSLRR